MAAGLGALVIGLGAGAAPAAASTLEAGPSAGHQVHAAKAPGPHPHGHGAHHGSQPKTHGQAASPSTAVKAASSQTSSAAPAAAPGPTPAAAPSPTTGKVPPGQAKKARSVSSAATRARRHAPKPQPAPTGPAPIRAKASAQARKSQARAVATATPQRPIVGPLTFTVAAPGGRSPLVLDLTSVRIPAASAPRAVPAAHRAAPHPAPAPAAFSGSVDAPLVAVGRGLTGLSLRAETRLRVPILFFLVVALFMAIQALIDRRDPKVVEAPEHSMDDSVGFE